MLFRSAAGHGHAGLGEAQFGGDHMHDPLAATADAVQGDAVLRAVGLERGQHFFGQRIGEGPRLAGGRHDVIHRGHGALGVAHAQAQILEAGKGLRAGHLMDQVQTDEQLAGTSRQLGHLMQIPDLVVEGAGAQGDAATGIHHPKKPLEPGASARHAAEAKRPSAEAAEGDKAAEHQNSSQPSINTKLDHSHTFATPPFKAQPPGHQGHTKHPRAMDAANPSLLQQPDFWFIVLSLLGSLSLLATSLIVFRFLAVFLSTGYLIVTLWVGLDATGMKSSLMTSLLNLGLNGCMIAAHFYSRSMMSLPQRWRPLYAEHFSLLLPFEFRRLLRFGRQSRIQSNHESDQNQLLVKAGSPFQALSIVLEGSASVSVDGKEVATLYPGDWISELAFLTGDWTSADVSSHAVTTLSWTADDLDRLRKKLPAVYEKLNLLISRNLCHKLIRSNARKEHSFPQET